MVARDTHGQIGALLVYDVFKDRMRMSDLALVMGAVGNHEEVGGEGAGPVAAAVDFRRVLQRNPEHYGATFQLATALDRAGKPTEARPLWEKALKMAEGYGDKGTQDTARARLARKP